MSAALAVSIERQVDAIIAEAKAACARLPNGTPFPSGASSRSHQELLAEQRRAFEAAAALIGAGEALARTLSPREKSDFWMRLRALLASRFSRA